MTASNGPPQTPKTRGEVQLESGLEYYNTQEKSFMKTEATSYDTSRRTLNSNDNFCSHSLDMACKK